MRRASIVLLLLVACAREQQAIAPLRKSKPVAKTASAAGQEETRSDIGDVMPAYSAKYLDGKPFDLKSAKGKVVLLNVWATWCGPCRFEIPELQALHEKYGERGLEVIGVSVDDTGADGVKQFVTENKITYPIVLDSDGRVANVLSTTVLPTSVIIGRDGRIVWRRIGAVMPNEISSLDDVVKQALSKKG